jgi:hypothetical protein
MTKLKRIDEARHIDHCDPCCMEAWLGQKTHASIIGWEPAPESPEFSPIALVCVCPTCGTSYWTHYRWIPISEEYLPAKAIKLLQNQEAT